MKRREPTARYLLVLCGMLLLKTKARWFRQTYTTGKPQRTAAVSFLAIDALTAALFVPSHENIHLVPDIS